MEEYEYNIAYTVLETGQTVVHNDVWTDDHAEAFEWVDGYERQWVDMVKRGYTKHYNARLVKRVKAGPMVDA